jgi:hypothetical protein
MHLPRSLAAVAAAFSLIPSTVALYDPNSQANLAMYWVRRRNPLIHVVLANDADMCALGWRSQPEQPLVLLRAVFGRHHSYILYQRLPSSGQRVTRRGFWR